MTGLFDSCQRRISYLRVSVTDRCNLRCVYCMTRLVPHLAHDDILRYEEICRVVQLLAGTGVRSVRLTGGEPLVRPNLGALVGMLAQVEGIGDISLTTNGTLLADHAAELKASGLKRVNISLDTFRTDRFRRITGSDGLEDVLRGIEAARRAELNPVKINMVVLRGINDDEVLDFARRSLDDGFHVRFIEHMPLVTAVAGSDRLVPVGEIMAAISNALGELKPCLPSSGRGPAKYYQLPGAKGTIGFIGAVTDCFCEECNRFRLTADGHLRPCLLDDSEVNIKGPLRGGASDGDLLDLVREAAAMKGAQHRLAGKLTLNKRPMWQIGG